MKWSPMATGQVKLSLTHFTGCRVKRPRTCQHWCWPNLHADTHIYTYFILCFYLWIIDVLWSQNLWIHDLKYNVQFGGGRRPTALSHYMKEWIQRLAHPPFSLLYQSRLGDDKFINLWLSKFLYSRNKRKDGNTISGSTIWSIMHPSLDSSQLTSKFSTDNFVQFYERRPTFTCRFLFLWQKGQGMVKLYGEPLDIMLIMQEWHQFS
jgi:hypothetical protein